VFVPLFEVRTALLGRRAEGTPCIQLASQGRFNSPDHTRCNRFVLIIYIDPPSAHLHYIFRRHNSVVVLALESVIKKERCRKLHL